MAFDACHWRPRRDTRDMALGDIHVYIVYFKIASAQSGKIHWRIEAISGNPLFLNALTRGGRVKSESIVY